MFRRTRLSAVLAITLCVLAFAPAAPARAADLLYDLSGSPAGALGAASDDETVGFEFTLSAAGTVSSLGIWDEGADGLSGPHEVGLWDSGGVLLASTTVTASSAATASGSGLGQWLFESITPVSLTAGTYTLGAFYAMVSLDEIRALVGTTVMSGASLSDGRYTTGPSLAQPTTDPSLSDSYYGPNALFGPAGSSGGGSSGGGGVPEPGTYAMCAGMALAALLTFRRKRSA